MVKNLAELIAEYAKAQRRYDKWRTEVLHNDPEPEAGKLTVVWSVAHSREKPIR